MKTHAKLIILLIAADLLSSLVRCGTPTPHPNR